MPMTKTMNVLERSTEGEKEEIRDAIGMYTVIEKQIGKNNKQMKVEDHARSFTQTKGTQMEIGSNLRLHFLHILLFLRIAYDPTKKNP